MSPAHEFTRRDLLRLGALGAGVALGAPLLTGCPNALPILEVPGEPITDTATVAAIKGHDLRAMTRQALDALGGIQTIVRPGETVFIKPNLLSAGLGRANPTITGECAKPDIAVALAEACLQTGVAQVTIGDGAQVYRFSWEELPMLDGSTNLAAEAARLNARYPGRVTLACLNSDSPAWDPVPARRTRLDEILVSSLVTRADRVISVAVLKNHRHSGMSLSMKNLVGATPIAEYGGGSEDVGRYLLHLAGMEGAFLDLVDAIRPDLAIIDASIGVEGFGPWVRPGEGQTVDLRTRLGSWLLLASTDPVAADATAVRIVSGSYEGVRHIATAYRQGFGQALPELITLVGATLDELSLDWKSLWAG